MSRKPRPQKSSKKKKAERTGIWADFVAATKNVCAKAVAILPKAAAVGTAILIATTPIVSAEIASFSEDGHATDHASDHAKDVHASQTAQIAQESVTHLNPTHPTSEQSDIIDELAERTLTGKTNGENITFVFPGGGLAGTIGAGDLSAYQSWQDLLKAKEKVGNNLGDLVKWQEQQWASGASGTSGNASNVTANVVLVSSVGGLIAPFMFGNNTDDAATIFSAFGSQIYSAGNLAPYATGLGDNPAMNLTFVELGLKGEFGANRTMDLPAVLNAINDPNGPDYYFVSTNASTMQTELIPARGLTAEQFTSYMMDNARMPIISGASTTGQIDGLFSNEVTPVNLVKDGKTIVFGNGLTNESGAASKVTEAIKTLQWMTSVKDPKKIVELYKQGKEKDKAVAQALSDTKNVVKFGLSQNSSVEISATTTDETLLKEATEESWLNTRSILLESSLMKGRFTLKKGQSVEISAPPGLRTGNAHLTVTKDKKTGVVTFDIVKKTEGSENEQTVERKATLIPTNATDKKQNPEIKKIKASGAKFDIAETVLKTGRQKKIRDYSGLQNSSKFSKMPTRSAFQKNAYNPQYKR